LPGATIVAGEGETHQETVSGDDGRFSFAGLPNGSLKVVVTAPDYEKYVTQETLKEGQRTQVLYYVRRKVYGAFETTVRAKKERKEVASISLKQEEIRLIPGTNGDAFRVIQNLPGVARVPYGLGFLVVRGSKPWDTRTYVDDAQVPLLFHFGGLFATFNSSLLETLTFQPGNFGADRGREGLFVRDEGRVQLGRLLRNDLLTLVQTRIDRFRELLELLLAVLSQLGIQRLAPDRLERNRRSHLPPQAAGEHVELIGERRREPELCLGACGLDRNGLARRGLGGHRPAGRAQHGPEVQPRE